ncbi:MAG: hypothetical protein ACM3JD_08610 [Rudaea sp.]
MKKDKNKIENRHADDLRPEYEIDYSKTWPNPYAGKVKHSHGGSRPGAGRHPRFGQPMVRKTIRLTEKEIARLERLGAGNLSEGVRAALRKAGIRAKS